jgi:hypothetical protein
MAVTELQIPVDSPDGSARWTTYQIAPSRVEHITGIPETEEGRWQLARLQLLQEAETRVLATQTQLRKLEDRWLTSRRRVERARAAAERAHQDHSALLRIADWRYTDKGNGDYEINGTYVYMEDAIKTTDGWRLRGPGERVQSDGQIPVARAIAFGDSREDGPFARVRGTLYHRGLSMNHFINYAPELVAVHQVRKEAEKLRRRASARRASR